MGLRRTEAQRALVKMRQLKGWTQTDLAIQLKRSWSTIAKWETSASPNVRVIEELAKFARKHNLPDIADLFELAISLENSMVSLEQSEDAKRWLTMLSVLLQNRHLPFAAESCDRIIDEIKSAAKKLFGKDGRPIRGLRIGFRVNPLARESEIKEPESNE